jgi:hypothetical protein
VAQNTLRETLSVINGTSPRHFDDMNYRINTPLELTGQETSKATQTIRDASGHWFADVVGLQAGTVVQAVNERESLLAQRDALRDALMMILNHYKSLVNSGDCGNWNPDEEPQVIQAQSVLALCNPNSNVKAAYPQGRYNVEGVKPV